MAERSFSHASSRSNVTEVAFGETSGHIGQASGGGGGGGELEQRVRQLEQDVSFFKGKLDDMPTKDWINTRLLTYFGVSLTVIGLMIKFL